MQIQCMFFITYITLIRKGAHIKVVELYFKLNSHCILENIAIIFDFQDRDGGKRFFSHHHLTFI